jgi:hypothetical protein
MRYNTPMLRSIATFAAALSLAGCTMDFPTYVEKLSPSGSIPHPLDPPLEVIPQRQTEPHTCGYHALAAIYLAYGLDPEAFKLRWRLGTDYGLPPAKDRTRGTLPIDLTRVLTQDRLYAATLDPEATEHRALLMAHLRTGHYGVALTYAGDWHWVAVCGIDGDQLQIADSLEPQKYWVDAESWLRDHAYSVILVRPRAAGR